MNQLIEHAKRELELVGEDAKVIEWYLKVVGTFSEFGHSGETAEHTLEVLEQLLRYRNLTPLTDDPKEWVDVSGYFEGKSIWQSIRNSEAFSADGGKTYSVLSEAGYISHNTLRT